MNIRRIVPNIITTHEDMCRDFYVGYLGLQVGVQMEWMVTYVSPSNPLAQISLIRGNVVPQSNAISITVEVQNVIALHDEANRLNYSIIYPLTDEPWGVRRFAVVDPNGVVINVMRHLTPRDAKQ